MMLVPATNVVLLLGDESRQRDIGGWIGAILGTGDDPAGAFLTGILSIGLTNQVTLRHIGPLPGRDEGQKQSLRIDLRIEGTLGHISGFLRDVTSNTTVVVEDVQLHEHAGQLSGSVRLRTVFLRE